jgi:hypothetical protein
MKILSLTLLTIFIALATLAQTTRPASGIEYHHGLRVRIYPVTTTYLPNQPLDFRVEFRNEGNTSIRVGRLVATSVNAPFRLSLKVEDSAGHVIVDPVIDLAELPCVDLRELDVDHPAIWTVIAPGSTYSTTLSLITRAMENLRPGRYKVHGLYRSYGVLEGGHCLNFKQYPRSSAGSTGTEWQGYVDTNDVEITILPPAEER